MVSYSHRKVTNTGPFRFFSVSFKSLFWKKLKWDSVFFFPLHSSFLTPVFPVRVVFLLTGVLQNEAVVRHGRSWHERVRVCVPASLLLLLFFLSFVWCKIPLGSFEGSTCLSLQSAGILRRSESSKPFSLPKVCTVSSAWSLTFGL